jgi:hypothetical protein
LVAAVRIEHVYQLPAQVETPHFRIVVHFVNCRKSVRQEEPVDGCTEFIAVSFHKLGTIRVIESFASSPNIVESCHRASVESFHED